LRGETIAREPLSARLRSGTATTAQGEFIVPITPTTFAFCAYDRAP